MGVIFFKFYMFTFVYISIIFVSFYYRLIVQLIVQSFDWILYTSFIIKYSIATLKILIFFYRCQVVLYAQCILIHIKTGYIWFVLSKFCAKRSRDFFITPIFGTIFVSLLAPAVFKVLACILQI